MACKTVNVWEGCTSIPTDLSAYVPLAGTVDGLPITGDLVFYDPDVQSEWKLSHGQWFTGANTLGFFGQGVDAAFTIQTRSLTGVPSDFSFLPDGGFVIPSDVTNLYWEFNSGEWFTVENTLTLIPYNGAKDIVPRAFILFTDVDKTFTFNSAGLCVASVHPDAGSSDFAFATKKYVLDQIPGTGGQDNTQTNIGAGLSAGLPKSGIDLPLRTFTFSGNIAITEETDTLDFTIIDAPVFAGLVTSSLANDIGDPAGTLTRKDYVELVVSLEGAKYVPSLGGQFTGLITNTTANSAGDAADTLLRKDFIESLIATGGGDYVPLVGGTMTGLLILSGNAVDSLGAVTLQQMQLADSFTLGQTVQLTGNQSVDGVKTFTSFPLLTDASAPVGNEAVNKNHLVAFYSPIGHTHSQYVDTSTAQNVGGIKDFTSAINNSGMPAGGGQDVQNNFGQLQFVSSDLRLKENLRALKYGLADLLLIETATFDWKAPHGNAGEEAIGFKAQQLMTVIPEAVIEREDQEYLGLNTQPLLPVIVKAIQELEARLTAAGL